MRNALHPPSTRREPGFSFSSLYFLLLFTLYNVSVVRCLPPCEVWEQGLFLLPFMCLARTSLEKFYGSCLY